MRQQTAIHFIKRALLCHEVSRVFLRKQALHLRKENFTHKNAIFDEQGHISHIKSLNTLLRKPCICEETSTVLIKENFTHKSAIFDEKGHVYDTKSLNTSRI